MTFSDEFNLDPSLKGEADSYRGVGDELRALREHQGHMLTDVAQSLRISSRYLRAIEEGRFEKLPGPAYVVGFLRTYSNFLGTDPKTIVDRFKAESTGFHSKPELEFPTPPRETSVPRTAIVVGSVLTAAVVFGAWIFLQTDEQVKFDAVPSVPGGFGDSSPTDLQKLAPPADDQIVPEIDETSDVETTPEPINSAVVAIESVDIEAEEKLTAVVPKKLNTLSDGSASTEEGQDDPRSVLEVVAEVSQTAPMSDDVSGDDIFIRDSVSNNSETITGNLAEAPAEPNLIPTPPPPPTSTVSQEPPRVYGHENADSRVTLLARQDSWVQVQSAENQLLITRILYSGDSYKVPDLEGLTLITGNAGGLEILIDGESISPLGPEGAVRRNIPLAPNALRALAENEGQ